MSSDDLDAIQQRISALTEAARRIAEARQQAGQTPPQSEGTLPHRAMTWWMLSSRKSTRRGVVHLESSTASIPNGQ